MNFKPVPTRPPGMADSTYTELMKRKRRAATRNGLLIGGLAVGFFLFPLAFVTWKNSQGSEGMLVNKTMASPGMKSVPIYQHELETGQQFSSLTTSQSEAQFNGLLNKPSMIDTTLSPQEQYKQFRKQKPDQQQKTE